MRSWCWVGLIAALLACPAQAATTYSLNGTVGDGNWSVAGPSSGGPASDLWLQVGLYPPVWPGVSVNRDPFDFSVPTEPHLIIKYSGGQIDKVDVEAQTFFWFESYQDCPGACKDIGGDDDFGGGPWVPLPTTVSGAVSTTPFFPEATAGLGPGGFSDYSKFYHGYQAVEFTVWVDPSAAGAPFSLTVFSVPEPQTWALLILGFAGLGAALRARRAQLPGAPPPCRIHA